MISWIAKLAGFALPSWGIYAMLAAAFVAWGGYAAYLMHEFDEGRHAAAATERTVLAAVQKYKADAQILAWKRLYEATNDKAKKLEEIRKLERIAADKRVFDAISKAGTSGRIVPSAPGSSAGDQRVCAARDQLDQLIGGAISIVVARDATRGIEGAALGVRAVDVATLCRDWTRALPQP